LYYLFWGDICGITAAMYRACNSILAYDSQLLFYIAVSCQFLFILFTALAQRAVFVCVGLCAFHIIMALF